MTPYDTVAINWLSRADELAIDSNVTELMALLTELVQEHQILREELLDARESDF